MSITAPDHQAQALTVLAPGDGFTVTFANTADPTIILAMADEGLIDVDEFVAEYLAQVADRQDGDVKYWGCDDQRSQALSAGPEWDPQAFRLRTLGQFEHIMVD